MRLITAAFRIVAAMAIAALALPVAGQNVKYFTLGAPSSIAVTTTTLDVTFKNVENGNSTFNAVSVEALPSAGTTVVITGATGTPGGPGSYLQLAGNKIALVGLSPTKKGQTLTVTLTLQVTGTSCGGGYIDWKGAAWTGSPSSPSTPFTQQNANPRTTLNVSCTFSVESVTPATLVKGTASAGTVRVRNASTSTANITQVTLTPPSGISTTTTTYSGLAIAPGNYADVAVAPSAPCDAAGSGGAWTAAVTGFTQTGTTPSTSVTGTCKLAFSGLPTSVVVGQPYTIYVDLLDGAGNKISGFGGSVNLLLAGSGCQLTATTPISAVGGTATFANISLAITNSVASCSLKATTTIGSTLFETTPPATLAVYEGILNCGGSLALDATNPDKVPQSAPGWAGGYRGASNAKGSECLLVNYTVNNTILADNTISLAWDTAAQPEAAFALSANFKPEDVDADGWPNNLKRPQTAWKFDSGGNPIFIKGIACVAPIAPVSYGTLSSAVSGGTSINVTLSSIAAPPPPFEIAIDGERLTVTSTGAGTNWTVATAIQGTHAAGAFVESRYPGLPEQYGQVTAIASSAATSTCSSNCATLDLTRTRDLPAAPFPIQVGAERLLVTKVLSAAPAAQVEVIRQHGGTPAAAAAGMKVMSTPLPLIPAGAIPSGVTAYQAGKPAQMCIVTFGWTAVGNNTSTAPPEAAKQQVMPFVEWYDIGDGWVSFR